MRHAAAVAVLQRGEQLLEVQPRCVLVQPGRAALALRRRVAQRAEEVAAVCVLHDGDNVVLPEGERQHEQYEQHEQHEQQQHLLKHHIRQPHDVRVHQALRHVQRAHHLRARHRVVVDLRPLLHADRHGQPVARVRAQVDGGVGAGRQRLAGGDGEVVALRVREVAPREDVHRGWQCCYASPCRCIVPTGQHAVRSLTFGKTLVSFDSLLLFTVQRGLARRTTSKPTRSSTSPTCADYIYFRENKDTAIAGPYPGGSAKIAPLRSVVQDLRNRMEDKAVTEAVDDKVPSSHCLPMCSQLLLRALCRGSVPRSVASH